VGSQIQIGARRVSSPRNVAIRQDLADLVQHPGCARATNLTDPFANKLQNRVEARLLAYSKWVPAASVPVANPAGTVPSQFSQHSARFARVLDGPRYSGGGPLSPGKSGSGEMGGMGTMRTQRSYDHPLVRLVRQTGDAGIATSLGVPRSTAAGWLLRPPAAAGAALSLDDPADELHPPRNPPIPHPGGGAGDPQHGHVRGVAPCPNRQARAACPARGEGVRLGVDLVPAGPRARMAAAALLGPTSCGASTRP